MEEKENKRNTAKDTESLIFLFWLIIIGLALFSVYLSFRYEYYPNANGTIIIHDKFNETITDVEILNANVKKTDVFWKLCFRFKYLKNENVDYLIRIDKFDKKAIYIKPNYIIRNGVKHKAQVDPLGILDKKEIEKELRRRGFPDSDIKEF